MTRSEQLSDTRSNSERWNRLPVGRLAHSGAMSFDPGSVVGAVMAGGLGSRLGGSKATAPLAGAPLISYPLAALREAGLPPVAFAKQGTELPARVPVVLEPDEPRHPLAGIVAALEYATDRSADAVVALACDLPLVPPGLLRLLAEAQEPLVLPVLDGHPQPLLARYDTILLPDLRAALADEPGPLTRLVMARRPRLLDQAALARFGDPHRILHNVNTAADLDRAAAWLHTRPKFS